MEEVPRGIQKLMAGILEGLLKDARPRLVQSGRGPARWCTGCPLAVSAVSGFVPV
jgi:hypothetical protein